MRYLVVPTDCALQLLGVEAEFTPDPLRQS